MCQIAVGFFDSLEMVLTLFSCIKRLAFDLSFAYRADCPFGEVSISEPQFSSEITKFGRLGALNLVFFITEASSHSAKTDLPAFLLLLSAHEMWQLADSVYSCMSIYYQQAAKFL